MKYLIKLSILIILFSCNKNEDPKEQVKNDCTGEYSKAGLLVEIMADLGQLGSLEAQKAQFLPPKESVPNIGYRHVQSIGDSKRI